MNPPIGYLIYKRGETAPGRVTVTPQRGETTVIIRYVPANIYDNCGEHYLSDRTTGQVLASAETAVANGAEIGIRRFAA